MCYGCWLSYVEYVTEAEREAKGNFNADVVVSLLTLSHGQMDVFLSFLCVPHFILFLLL